MRRSPKEVGALIKDRRESLGLIQEGIENVSSALIGNIENGTAPIEGRGPTRAVFMRALGWPPDAYKRLLDGEDPDTFPDGGRDRRRDDRDPNAELVDRLDELTQLVIELRDEVRQQRGK